MGVEGQTVRLSSASLMMPPPPPPHSSCSSAMTHVAMEGRSNSFGGGGGQPMASKGFKSERDRREWIEKELDLCSQSQIYQKILDGELAQRAQVRQSL